MEWCKIGTNTAFRLEDTAIEDYELLYYYPFRVDIHLRGLWTGCRRQTNRPPPSLKLIPSDCFVGLSQTESLPIKTKNTLRNETRNRDTFAYVSCRIVCKNEIQH